MKLEVKKSIDITAPLEEVRPLLADFANWNSWSPWMVIEPGCKQEVKGEPGKPGHSMSWDGEIIGAGEMAVKEVSDTELSFNLTFLKPFKSKAVTNFQLTGSGTTTTVVWTMDSKLPFFLFFMLNTMRNMIGMDFDRGLRMLKAVVEDGAVKAKTENQGVGEAPSFSYVGIRRTLPFAQIGEIMQADFDRLMDELEQRGTTARHWVTLYETFDLNSLTLTYVAAMSDESLEGTDLGSDFVRGEVKGGKALHIKHSGSYQFLGNAWAMGMMTTRAKKMKQRDLPFEYYHNNPKETAEEDLETSVYFPLR